MKKFYLIRHGTTELNNTSDISADRIRAWLDVPLDHTGLEDAKKTAKNLLKSDIKIILASDLRRSRQTADIIGKALGVKVVTTGLLRPWDLGEFAGKPTKEVIPKVLEFVSNKPDEKVPGGESFNSFCRRAFRGLDKVLEYDELVGAVTHHRVERLYKAWIANGCPKDKSIKLDVFSQKGENPGHSEMIKVC